MLAYNRTGEFKAIELRTSVPMVLMADSESLTVLGNITIPSSMEVFWFD